MDLEINIYDEVLAIDGPISHDYEGDDFEISVSEDLTITDSLTNVGVFPLTLEDRVRNLLATELGRNPTNEEVLNSMIDFNTTGLIGGFDIGEDFLSITDVELGNTTKISSGNIAFQSGPTDAPTTTITQDGQLTSVSGEIGGFQLGEEYIRDTNDSFGMSSTVTPADDIRFWAGDTFANRATAPFSVTEGGIVTATDIKIGPRRVIVSPGENIQDAIDKLGTGGGEIFLLNGFHYCNYDIILSSNQYLWGENAEATFIDFYGNANQIRVEGTDAYSSGNVSVSNNSVLVYGSGTAWTTNVSVGQNIMLSGLWYPVAEIYTDVLLRIGVPYADVALSAVDYTIVTIINDVRIENMTIRNSGTTALQYRYSNEGFFKDLNIQTSVIGISFHDCSQFYFGQIDITACYTNWDFYNAHFIQHTGSGSVDSLAGEGMILDTVTNSSFSVLFVLNSAYTGISITDCRNVSIDGVFAENGNHGIEFVSGNDSINLRNFRVDKNAGDGIKLTSTTTNLVIGPGFIKNNAGYGINIASNCNTSVITGNILFNNDSGAVLNNGAGNRVIGNIGVPDSYDIVGDAFEVDAISITEEVTVGAPS